MPWLASPAGTGGWRDFFNPLPKEVYPMKRQSIYGLALALLLMAVPAAKAGDFTYYAPPMVYGPWQTVNAIQGPGSFVITYQALGNTTLFGQVRYFDESGNQVVKPLVPGFPYRLGPGLGAVEVRFFGSSLGSGVKGNITP